MCSILILLDQKSFSMDMGFDVDEFKTDLRAKQKEEPGQEEEKEVMTRETIVENALNMVNFVDQQLKAIADQKEVIDWTAAASPELKRASSISKMPMPILRDVSIKFEIPDDPATIKNKEENEQVRSLIDETRQIIRDLRTTVEQEMPEDT